MDFFFKIALIPITFHCDSMKHRNEKKIPSLKKNVITSPNTNLKIYLPKFKKDESSTKQGKGFPAFFNPLHARGQKTRSEKQVIPDAVVRQIKQEKGQANRRTGGKISVLFTSFFFYYWCNITANIHGKSIFISQKKPKKFLALKDHE